jgi:DHA1 family tetracycline resistance protein-like MFS transporter
MQTEVKSKKSPLIVIFTTVFLDLIGFGIIIPLVGIYGRDYGANTYELAILGSIYSIMQFVFSPIWGRLSDKHGRRPILLMSLLGSVISYYLFAFANTLGLLILSRALAGIFAANISTAQAYIADVTKPEDRAKGMGLIGAAFGIGFTLGPPVGGISVAKLGMSAPGLIAGTLCLLNLILAWYRLDESLSPELQAKAYASSAKKSRLAQFETFQIIKHKPALVLAIVSTFFATFAFSNLEQVFSLFIQTKFSLATEEAAYKTGMILMWSGVLGAFIQGGLIRKLVPKHGEQKLLIIGLFTQALAMVLFSQSPTYGSFFITAVPLAFGSGLINPTLASLVSKGAEQHEQGAVMGLKEGMSSLARIFGPLSGLLAFGVQVTLPFIIGALTVSTLGLVWLRRKKI